MRAALLALVLPSLALAGAPPSEVKKRFQVARQHHERGELREAIEIYLEIYEMRPAPQLLFNVGQCHRNLGELEAATGYFRRYAEGVSDPIERDRVEALIVDLEAELADREAEAAMTVVTATVAELEPPPPVVAPPPRSPPVAPVDPVVIEAVEERSIAGEWWFWTIIGVAAAAAAGGTAAVLLSRDPAPEGSIATIDAR
jgi:tetratricopeptide (TPR) repeat protein